MQGGHGNGAYGYGAGSYASAGGYGYDASASAGGTYYSSVSYPPAPPYEDPLVTAGRRRAHEFPAPVVDGVELQASEACPKNYVIFDQTSTSSWVTFHPSLAHRLTTAGGSSSSATAGYSAGVGDDAWTKGVGNEDDLCSPVREKEDSAEIDALLMSSEDGSADDDVTSTGRAPGGGGGSPDSTCSSSGGGMPGRKKKERIKKMMRTLKGIIPGGGQMDTTAALDEAVCYLKSLNVQANKRPGG